MRILSVIDSFKGSMTSQEANLAVKRALQHHDVVTFPIADGGEGTIDALTAQFNGELRDHTVTGPNGEQLQVKWGYVKEKNMAILEVAEAAGITKVPVDQLDPYLHTSYGVGEQIRLVLDYGVTEIMLGLGGSATIDGGFGLIQALGAIFYDKANNVLPMLPIQLDRVHSVDFSEVDPRLQQTNFSILTDVTNPLCGPNGAAYVFGAQKGLKELDFAHYDQAMNQYRAVIETELATRVQSNPGAGAAGGIGFIMHAYFKANVSSGLEWIAENGKLTEAIAAADLVITGEGKLDLQSLQGKVPIGIYQLATAQAKQTLFVSGFIDAALERDPTFEQALFLPIVDHVTTLDSAMKNGPGALEQALRRAFTFIDYGKSLNID